MEKEITNKERELISINKVMEVLGEYFTQSGLTHNYDQYSSHDVDLTGITSMNINYECKLEVKQRNVTNLQLKQYFNEGGLMIEDIKYNHLKQFKNKLYANYINNSHYQLILVWNLDKLTNVVKKTIVANATTEFENREKKDKPSQLLSLNDVSLAYVKHMNIYTEMPWHKLTLKNLKTLINK